jgi:hypothetical protein
MRAGSSHWSIWRLEFSAIGSLETINTTHDVTNAVKNIPFLIGQLIAEIITIDTLNV